MATKRTRFVSRLQKKIRSSSSSLKILDYLPSEIVAQIVAQVASSSFDDLFRCKLSCKALLEITKEKQALERTRPCFLWSQSKHAESFFKRCQECQNPEALFQLGIWQYFSLVMVEEGKANLEKAGKQGHMVATYALGLILLCTGASPEKERGVSLVMKVMERFKGKGIIECRNKLHKRMRSMWINNNHIQKSNKPIFLCALENEHGRVWHGWREACNYDDEWEDLVLCQTCRCQRELEFFFKLLPLNFLALS